MISDAELVRAVKSGERRLYGDLVARYERAVKAAALHVLSNYHDAQDAAQEAFVIAYQRLGELREEGAFGGWLLRIAHNEALRLARRPRPAALSPPWRPRTAAAASMTPRSGSWPPSAGCRSRSGSWCTWRTSADTPWPRWPR